MAEDDITLKPIGIIHSPFKKPEGTPIQPGRSNGAGGTVEVYPDFVAGLEDLDGFSHIILLYFFHLSKGYNLMVTPYLDDQERGLFATRAPKRPNSIGLSVVKLDKIEENILHVINIDIIDGTPLLDIKPYVPDFDSSGDFRIGWLEGRMNKNNRYTADDRFHKEGTSGENE